MQGGSREGVEGVEWREGVEREWSGVGMQGGSREGVEWSEWSGDAGRE